MFVFPTSFSLLKQLPSAHEQGVAFANFPAFMTYRVLASKYRGHQRDTRLR